MLAALPLALINRLLATETWAMELLRPHAGQTAALDLAGLSLRFCVGPTGLLQEAAADSPAEVAIRIAAADLPGLLDDRDTLHDAIHVTGNARFADTLARLARHLRPDLAAQLAPWLGDVAAHRVAQGAHSLGQVALGNGRKLAESGLAWLRDERRLLVRKDELHAFAERLDALRERLQRLDKTLQAKGQ